MVSTVQDLRSMAVDRSSLLRLEHDQGMTPSSLKPTSLALHLIHPSQGTVLHRLSLNCSFNSTSGPSLIGWNRIILSCFHGTTCTGIAYLCDLEPWRQQSMIAHGFICNFVQIFSPWRVWPRSDGLVTLSLITRADLSMLICHMHIYLNHSYYYSGITNHV